MQYNIHHCDLHIMHCYCSMDASVHFYTPSLNRSLGIKMFESHGVCVYEVHLEKKEKRCQSFRWEIKNISIYYSDMKNLNAYTLFCELIETCSVWRDDGHIAYKRTEIIHKGSAQTHVQSQGRTKRQQLYKQCSSIIFYHINNIPHPSNTV